MAIMKFKPTTALAKEDDEKKQAASNPTGNRGGGGGTWGSDSSTPTIITSPTLYPSMVPATKPNTLNTSTEQLEALNDLVSSEYPNLPKVVAPTEPQKSQKEKELARIEEKKAGMSAEELEAMERKGIETQLEAINNGDAEMTEEFVQTLIKYGYMDAPDITKQKGLPLSPQEQLREQRKILDETSPDFGKEDPFAEVREKVENITETGTKTETGTESVKATVVPREDKGGNGSDDNFDADDYDPVTDAAYREALAALQAARNEIPTYKGTHDDRLNEIYQQILGREPFRYDAANDVMYQQYADNAQRNGQLAMRDTMGQAAAMTGGYGNSYAATAGNQAYLAYMEDVNRMLPEFYGMARDAYDAEGERLMTEYALTEDLSDEEYNRYLNDLDEYYRRVSLLKDEADDAYNRKIYEEKTAYERAQDAYDRMAERIAGSGRMPNEAELAAVGMSREEAESYYDIYRRKAEANGETFDSFTGTTHAEAVAYMQRNGVPAQLANMLVSEEDWNAAKKNGSTAYEVAAYETYAEFLADAVADAIENYGK